MNTTSSEAKSITKTIFHCLHCDRPFESPDELAKHQKALKEVGPNEEVVKLFYQQIIEGPPVEKEHLYQAAVSADHVTITSWYKTWMDHTRENCKNFDIHKHSLMSEFGKWAYKPGICAGSGPSLKRNIHMLKEGADEPNWPKTSKWPGRGEIGMISCLHNFAYFEDNGTPADYYVNLDAGKITIDEFSQGGKEKDPEHYWNLTKDRTLVTALVGHPDLIKKWKGRVLFFNTSIPEANFYNEQKEITKNFNVFVQTGGNALGACMYIARAILGANPLVFIGADFAFGYDQKFHPFENPYEFKGVMFVTDVFGNKVGTWPSYRNFAQWFAYIACGGKGNNPITMINCTEGGILGAYSNGNIAQIKQQALRGFLYEYHAHKIMPEFVNGDFPNFLF